MEEREERREPDCVGQDLGSLNGDVGLQIIG